MMTFLESPVEAASTLAMVLFSIAICLSVVRLIIGPSLPDRVMALDMVSILLVGLLVVVGTATSQSDAVRVAVVLALISFVGTVGFSVYMLRRDGR